MAQGTPSWLNSDFMEKVLRKFEGDDSIRVISIDTKPATNKGDNYTSEMIRTFVEYNATRNGKSVACKKSTIVKIAPYNDGIHKELIAGARLFETEIAMMSDTLTKMNKMLVSSNTRLSGTVLYTERGDPSILVLEDLALLGFRMADRQSGLNLEHCLLAIRGLARFHATSVALCEKEPKIKTQYARSIFHHDHPDNMKAFFIQGTKALGEECANWNGLDPKISEKVLKFAEKCYDKAADAAKLDENEFNVLNHGDFWVNNMMFRYDDKGNPIDQIMVDFQLSCYASPAIDLLYFLNTSPSEEVYINHRSSLIEEYQKTLSSLMKQLNCKTSPPTVEYLENQLRQRAVYGMVSGFTVYPIVLVDRTEAQNLDEIMGQSEGYENKAYKGDIYRNVMSKRLPEYLKLGLLDV